MLCDVYYPIITQTSYGQPTKDWVYDRSIACNLTTMTRKGIEDNTPDAYIKMEGKLVGRTKSDPRFSSHDNPNAITNILFSNIRTANNELLYRETSGPRNGKGTIFEIGTVEPFMGASNTIEYYKVVVRRAENQAVGD
jgi:hypothetical protein